MNFLESRSDDVVYALEFTPTHDSEERLYPIDVPADAAAVTFGVGYVVDGKFRLPNNVYLELRRKGEVIQPTDSDKESATFGKNGLVSFISNDPTPGKWELLIQHKEPEQFTVCVAVFRRPLSRLRSFISARRCRACKIALKAALYALLAKLAALAGGTYDLHRLSEAIASLSKAALDFLANTIGFSVDTLRELLTGLAEILDLRTPVDWLARRICERLGLCSEADAGDD